MAVFEVRIWKTTRLDLFYLLAAYMAVEEIALHVTEPSRAISNH